MFLKTILFVLLLLFKSKAAISVNKESAKCIEAINYYESKYNIPRGLLYSIAVVESGKLDDVEKIIYPWPWAVNVEGEAHYFDDEYAAIHFVKSKLASGVKSIDVGCNQISLLHHGRNFPSLNHIFNPHQNARYAAEFLQSKYNEAKNWAVAVGWYHSKTHSLSRLYSHKVQSVWRKLIESSKPLDRIKKNHKYRTKKSLKHTDYSNKRREKSVVFMKK